MALGAAFRDLSIRHKLRLIILGTCAAVLLLATVGFVGHEGYRFRRDLVTQYTTLADVVAGNAAAAIAFRDPKAGEDILGALRGDPHVVHASLADRDGALFAQYLRDDLSAAGRETWAQARDYPSWDAYQRHHHASGDRYRLGLDHLDVFAPVVLDGETIGHLFLQMDMERLYTGLAGYGVIVGLVMLAALVLALGLSQRLQKVISEPIQTLAAHMRDVSVRRDYSVRVVPASRDEVGALFAGFNDMLAQIADRDRRLAELAAAVEQAPDGIAILDPDGRVRRVNQAFGRLTGWADAGDLALDRLYPVAMGECARDQVLAAVREGTPWSGRVRARRADGGEYDEFCSLAPVTDEGGRVTGVLLLKRDITRELQMEERVRESQKLQALGTLAGGIAHDFNNLMSPVVAYSELLLEQAEPGTKTHTRLERITEAAVEASALVKQILAFSRPGSQARQPLPVQSLVKECVKLFHMALPPDLEVECRADAHAPPVAADPSQLHQVLMNLLTNAKHAMRERGGTIQCRVESATPAAHEVPDRPELAGRECVAITVRDHGHGMAPEVRERIFEPFFSTKGLGEGTGMGLAVVRGIVDDHGGSIAVESELGRGTTFRVLLPVAADGAAPEPDEAPPAVGGGETVALLEEDGTLREPLCEALGLLGYQALGVGHAEELLAAASAGGLDAAILDEHHLSGDLVGRVRAAAPGLPLVVCTGAEAQECRTRLADAEPWSIVEKPLSPLGLGAALQEVCRGPAQAGDG